ncbi:MAG: hypothetical protein A2X49_07245 [Lentisphaerae bacterium GWF2_52_8]|nr:MAG: hypothetical protein A2X49_07245 [Lentisphaerae bacterium GWF2_52_8]
MKDNLRKLVKQAKLIEKDDLYNEELDRDISGGALGQTFSHMKESLRELANNAMFIANDDLYNKKLDAKISKGSLGNAFGEMRDKLRGFAGQIELISKGALKKSEEKLSGLEGGGVLSSSIRSMCVNLKELISNIVKVSSTIKDATGEITSATEQMSAATRTQNEKISDTSASITELSSSIQEISQSSKSAEKMAGEANQAALNGAVVVKNTIQGLDTITRNIKTASGMTKKLGERSSEIGKIVNTITEISEQTNLLALNAAIEAARAGEHGRGFAVVADEVRKLAERSASSAKEISLIIEKIQGEMELTINTMDQASHSAVEGMELSRGLDTSFNNIQSSVTSTNASIEDIAAALGQQAQVCDDIVSAVETLTKVLKETEQSTVHLVRQMEELKNSVEQLEVQTGKFEV